MHTDTHPSRNTLFWDRIAPKYARQPIKDQAAYAAKLSALDELLTPMDTVLEVGCGTGGTAARLAPKVARYHATDMSPAMIDIARERHLAAEGRRLSFAVAVADDQADGGPFDVVLAFSLFHLIDDLPSTLAAIHDQLKPGGRLVSKTVCLGEANILIRGFVRALRLCGFAPPVTFLTQAQLERIIEAAGFVIETRRSFSANRLNPFIVARKAG